MALGPAKLRLINPFFKSVHDPRSKTVMGGMLAITVLPAILLLYALDPDAPAVVGAPVKKSGTGDVGETSSKV